MPLVCNNNIILFGRSAEVQRFLYDAKLTKGSTDFDFTNLVPTDGSYEHFYEQYGVRSLPAEFSIDMDGVSLSHPDSKVVLVYATAGGPATRFWETVSLAYKLLITEIYEDESSAFGGRNYILCGKAGESISAALTRIITAKAASPTATTPPQTPTKRLVKKQPPPTPKKRSASKMTLVSGDGTLVDECNPAKRAKHSH